MNKRLDRALLIGGVLLIAALMAAGCGMMGDSSETTAPQKASPSPAASATSTPAASTQATPAAAPAVAPVAPAPTGLGTQDHEISGVEVVLLEVKRTSGDSITVKWLYRNKTQQDKTLSTSSASWVDPYRLSYEAYLIDPVNKKKYLVLKDAEGKPIAARHGSSISVPAGQLLNTWAKFPAPPADVTKISIYIPHVAPFEDIPISQ